jgi:hypothetical protein
MKNRSIVLRGEPEYNEEGVATETIKPGYLVKGVSFLANQTANSAACPFAIAVERDELGQGIDNTRQGSGTSTAFYASGDTVKVAVCDAGDQVVAYIASGQNIQEDELLDSVGDGTLKTSGGVHPVARSLTDAGLVAAVTAIRVEVL